MITIKSINEINNIKRSVVTIGNFDGIHKGHEVLIKKAVEHGKQNNIKSIVFTFENHPANYFVTDSIKNIITNEQRINRLNELGVDIVVSIPFDECMTKISAQEFVEKILVDELHVEKIIVGYDFTFARNKEGNTNVLRKLSKQYNYELEVIKPIKIDGTRVSSTYIRNLLNEGNVYNIIPYLGHNYELQGTVVHAKKLGRTIGFPTANIEIDKEIIMPKNGIYATKIHIEGKTYFGATNIGYNPTVNGSKLSIETNILEFSEDIYGKLIKIEFLERIRDEKKFLSLDELKNQLGKDTNYVFEKYICKSKEFMIK